MADKNRTPNREQRIFLASRGYQPALYEVLYDLPHSMIIRHIETKEPAILYKD